MAMPKLSRLERIRRLMSKQRDRQQKNFEDHSNVSTLWRKDEITDDMMPEYKEYISKREHLGDQMSRLKKAYDNEELSRDLENATGDAARFRDEVVNFVGPREMYQYRYQAPRKVRQKDIRDMKYTDAYNLNEIPESFQREFIDNGPRGMHLDETDYSIGTYGVNGKAFRNQYGDEFYVPNRSTNVFRH